MYAKDNEFLQEEANLEFVVANLNRLHPGFVVLCGDLTNRTGDNAEVASYKQIMTQLDPAIPFITLPAITMLGIFRLHPHWPAIGAIKF